MDAIREIIHTLTDEEQKEFRHFAQRQRKRTQRKDLELFDLFKKKEVLKPAAVITKLYGTTAKKEAYHGLRKRLLKQLTDYIVLRNLETDSAAVSSAMGQLSLARYLFDQRSEELAWKYLQKAEQLATESEQYDLLNAIYNLQIEKSAILPDLDLDHLIQQQRHNKKLADEDERANMANALVKRELLRMRREGEDIDFAAVIDRQLSAFNLKEAMTERPKLLFNLISMSRSAILVKKDFYNFEPFLIRNYERLEKEIGFTARQQNYRLSFLYMIAHTLYRNKKFDRSISYLDQLNELIQKEGKAYFSLHYANYTQLYAANLFFKGELESATTLLLGLLEDKKVRLQTEDQLNITVNLGIYYFHHNTLKKAHAMLLSIYHTDKWCEKVMGKEWVLKKNLMEVLLYYDMEHTEVAESRMRSIERNYAHLLDQPVYQRVKVYMALVRQLIFNPETIRTLAFEERVEGSFQWVPVEQEDIQAMAFYAWLKSKMIKKPFYDTLLDLVSGS